MEFEDSLLLEQKSIQVNGERAVKGGLNRQIEETNDLIKSFELKLAKK
jgi:hypothetical protein